MSFKPIQLGDRVKDPVSGAVGIAVSTTVYLHGCIRIGVQPEKTDKDGKLRDPQYFDQSQLVVVKVAVHTPMVLTVAEAPPTETRRTPGGPAREAAGFRRG